MNGPSCYAAKNNMPHTPFAVWQKKGGDSCAHFAASRAGIITIIVDTILMVSIFVILALGLLHAALRLPLQVVILTILAISAHSFIIAKEQP